MERVDIQQREREMERRIQRSVHQNVMNILERKAQEQREKKVSNEKGIGRKKTLEGLVKRVTELFN